MNWPGSRCGPRSGGLLQMIPWLSCVALLAVQRLAHHAHSSGVRGDPRPQNPGRGMAHMLKMPARKLGNPMALVVLMITRNTLPHDSPDPFVMLVDYWLSPQMKQFAIQRNLTIFSPPVMHGDGGESQFFC